ncbi:MAG: immunity 17 family protein [Cyanobacteria bacterium P01_G01_bin.49]
MMGLLVIAGGIFALCGAILNWDWYMNHRKARFFVKIFGRTGARIFYGILGVGLIILGGLIALGILE